MTYAKFDEQTNILTIDYIKLEKSDSVAMEFSINGELIEVEVLKRNEFLEDVFEAFKKGFRPGKVIYNGFTPVAVVF